MSWNEIKLKELEKVFNEIFSPELLYGKQAEIYDEALSQSNHYGITWKQEMMNKDMYVDFVIDYLENEGVSPEDFKSN
jgi:hypothetical protein